MHWFSLILGLLIGWVVEWVIDLLYWRRRYTGCLDAKDQLHEELGTMRSNLWQVHMKAAQVDGLQAELAKSHARVAELEAEVAALRQGPGAEAEASPFTAGVADTPNKAQAFPAVDSLLSSAVPNGATGSDNLEVIEGIGPAIARLLNDNGIHSFAALAAASPAQLGEILAGAGSRFRMADPESWPQQAQLALEGAWDALKELQGRLRAGRA